METTKIMLQRFKRQIEKCKPEDLKETTKEQLLNEYEILNIISETLTLNELRLIYHLRKVPLNIKFEFYRAAKNFFNVYRETEDFFNVENLNEKNTEENT